jgi:hypothetical protein
MLLIGKQLYDSAGGEGFKRIKAQGRKRAGVGRLADAREEGGKTAARKERRKGEKRDATDFSPRVARLHLIVLAGPMDVIPGGLTMPQTNRAPTPGLDRETLRFYPSEQNV